MVAILADYANSLPIDQPGPVQIGAVMSDVLARYGLALPNSTGLHAVGSNELATHRPTWAPVFDTSAFDQATDPWLDDVDCPLADALLATW